MEVSWDLSLIMVLLGLTGIAAGYFLHSHSASLHDFRAVSIAVKQLLFSDQTCPHYVFHYRLGVRKKIPGRRTGKGQIEEEASSSRS